MIKNIQTEFVDGTAVSLDQVEILDPRETEAALIREQLEAEREARLRLAAEYKNYRRRTDQEKETAADRGKKELLTELLSLADDLDLAAANRTKSPKAIAEGVEMIHRRLRDILKTNSVTTFVSKGKKFDPDWHEAFGMVEAGQEESGIVHQEMRRGYAWNGRLLRPSLVIVSK